MHRADLSPAPSWVRPAATLIRHLPAGRYRIINRICRQPPRIFLTNLPRESGGYSFQCDLRDAIAREVCFTGRYEPQETALIRAILRPGMSFVDVGANWGYFTLVAAHLVGREGRVISFEPDPRLFPILQENIDDNELDQVTALQIAVADQTGTLTLAGYDEATGNFGLSRLVSSNTVTSNMFCVATRPLDSVLEELNLEFIDLLKMDIEGAEGLALNGLERALSNLRIGRLLLELHPSQLAEHGQSVEEVISHLQDHGYQAWAVDHSHAATRLAAYSKQIEARTLLRAFNVRRDLKEWPHLLWVMPGLEPLP
ncbi:MAG TPA: FkbM family methyltransferase [Pyrinomonadaceae bacterium]|nr:FkbM family methyltransferase [Pyrinomonadaceae bacterium]